MWKGKLYYLYISQNHRIQVKKASEKLSPILVQQTYMSERDFGHIKLYQVTKDDALASMK